MKTYDILPNVLIAAVIGMAFIISIKSSSADREIQSNTIFVVELAKDIMSGQRITAESIISNMSLVQRNSVELVSRDVALHNMKEEMAELDELAENPFLDIITFQTTGFGKEDFEAFRREVLDIEGVQGLYYDDMMIAESSHQLKSFRMGLITLSVMILLGCIYLLRSSIKQRTTELNKDIRVMSIAGAHEDTIVRATVISSTQKGVVVAAIAALVMLVNIIFINYTLLIGAKITFLQSFIAIALMFILVVAIHALVTIQSLRAFFSSLNLSIIK